MAYKGKGEPTVVDGVSYYKMSGVQTAAILLMIMFVYVNGMATPALAAISAVFPDVDIALIQQIASLPALTSVLGALIVAPLSKVMSQKLLFIIGMILVVLTGFLPGIIPNFTFMMICRALIGVGTGMSLSLALAFVPALFAPGKPRDKIFGLGTAVGAIVGICAQLGGGFLATLGWSYCFLGALVTVPFAIFLMVVLPDPGKAVAVDDGLSSSQKRAGFTGRTWALLFLGFLAPIFFFAFMTNMALAIAGQQLGDPAITGTVMAMYLVGTVVNGVLVPAVKKVVGKFYFACAFLLYAVALFILILVPALPAYFVAAFIFGIGFGMYNVEFGVRLSESCAPQSATAALSLFTAVGGVGQFLSPVVLAPLAMALGLMTPIAQWSIAAPCMLVIAVVVFFVQVMKNKRDRQ